MARSQCVCGDCAEQYDHISPVSWEVNEIECEEDHGDEPCDCCDVGFECQDCSEVYTYESDAKDCCPQWECNFCGYVHSGNPAKDAAAACCAQHCDDCDAYGWPDWLAEHSCNSGMGVSQELPWERRGIKVEGSFDPDAGREWKQVWGFAPENMDVVQAAADYYLLEAMKAGLVGTTDGEGHIIAGLAESTTFQLILAEAAEAFTNLVNTWDPILQAYTHMACGGELRHHVAVGGSVLNGDRDVAWSGWKNIYDAVGPDALEDAAALFLEFEGSSFGGELWADACKILHARVTGVLTPALFLDRIFNAQHNGGVLLNKVTWFGEKDRYTAGKYQYSISELQSRVLPAHGEAPEPDYSTLLAYASSEVRALFSDCFTYAGHAAKELGVSLTNRRIKPITGHTRQQAYKARQTKAKKEQDAYAALPESEKIKLNIAKYEQTLVQYTPLARQEAKDNTKLDAQKAAAGAVLCSCGCEAESEGGWSYKTLYYTGIVKSYKRTIAQLKAKVRLAQAAEAQGKTYSDMVYDSF